MRRRHQPSARIFGSALRLAALTRADMGAALERLSNRRTRDLSFQRSSMTPAAMEVLSTARWSITTHSGTKRRLMT